MALEKTFQDIALGELLGVANRKKVEGWRAVQLFCTNTEEGIDVTYTFNKDNVWENYRIRGVKPEDTVPSIQGMYLAMFPFENEAHDLFGVNYSGMVLDFDGRFYDLAQPQPMTIISPAQQAAREKAKKAAAAAAAKGKPQAAAAEAPKILTPEEIEAKVAGMDPEKAAKVRAALQAKAAKQAAEAAAATPAAEAAAPAAPKILTPEEIEAKVAHLDPEKAAKARAALQAKAAKQAAEAAAAAGKDGE